MGNEGQPPGINVMRAQRKALKMRGFVLQSRAVPFAQHEHPICFAWHKVPESLWLLNASCNMSTFSVTQACCVQWAQCNSYQVTTCAGHQSRVSGKAATAPGTLPYVHDQSL